MVTKGSRTNARTPPRQPSLVNWRVFCQVHLHCAGGQWSLLPVASEPVCGKQVGETMTLRPGVFQMLLLSPQLNLIVQPEDEAVKQGAPCSHCKHRVHYQITKVWPLNLSTFHSWAQ
jgi:hypothetical protein